MQTPSSGRNPSGGSGGRSPWDGPQGTEVGASASSTTPGAGASPRAPSALDLSVIVGSGGSSGARSIAWSSKERLGAGRLRPGAFFPPLASSFSGASHPSERRPRTNSVCSVNPPSATK
eukprot:4729891-Pyramimonas_sp.AAC.1